MRRLGLVAVGAVALMVMCLQPVAAVGDGSGAPAEVLRRQKGEARRRLAVAEAQAGAAWREVAEAEVRLAAARRALEEAREEARTAEAALRAARARREALEAEYRRTRRHLDAWLRLLQRDGGLSYLEVVLQATDFSDFAARVELVSAVLRRQVAGLREAARLRAEMEREEAAVAARAREAAARRAAAEAAAARLERLLGEREEALAAARASGP